MNLRQEIRFVREIGGRFFFTVGAENARLSPVIGKTTFMPFECYRFWQSEARGDAASDEVVSLIPK